MKEMWMVFTLDGKELWRCTVRGLFPGELTNTKAVLAYENGVDEDDIEIRLIKV